MMIAITKVTAASVMAILMATTVSSSFVPRTSLTRVSRVERQRYFLSVKGGSEEHNIESAEAQQDPQLSFPEPIQPLDVTEATQDVSLVPVPAVVVQTHNFGPKAPAPGMLRRTFPSFPWYQVPNYLTYARCLAIPALVYSFYQPNMNLFVGILFAIASFTDWLDGYLARRWDITSTFGAFLDPVADKLMVSTSIILLAGRYGAKVAIPACIILAREIAVSALREWMAQRGQRDAVKVGYQGKVKTALTMFALTVLLFVPHPGSENDFFSKLLNPGLAMLYLCSVVTITSGSVYFIAAAPLLRGDSR
jgi:CDP-diacylglycerol--glycerol-3-phosphate 3-phosphatidyltransferase